MGVEDVGGTEGVGSEGWVQIDVPRAMSHDGTQDRHCFRLPTGTPVTLFHVRDGTTGESQLYCMDALCHHQAGEVGLEGIVDVEDAWGPGGHGPRVQCPAHGRKFSLETGDEVGAGPGVPRAQRVYEVKVRRDQGNSIWVRYPAERDETPCLSDRYAALDAARHRALADAADARPPLAKQQQQQQGLLTNYYKVVVGKRTTRLAEATEAVQRRLDTKRAGRPPAASDDGVMKL